MDIIKALTGGAYDEQILKNRSEKRHGENGSRDQGQTRSTASGQNQTKEIQTDA